MANSHDLFNFNITQNDWIWKSKQKSDNNLHWRLPICVHNCNRWTYFTGQLLTLDTPNTIQYAMQTQWKNDLYNKACIIRECLHSHHHLSLALRIHTSYIERRESSQTKCAVCVMALRVREWKSKPTNQRINDERVTSPESVRHKSVCPINVLSKTLPFHSFRLLASIWIQ